MALCLFIVKVQKNVKRQQKILLDKLTTDGIRFDLLIQDKLNLMGIDEKKQLLVIVKTVANSLNILDTQTSIIRLKFSDLHDVKILRDEELSRETKLQRGLFRVVIKAQKVRDINAVAIKIVTDDVANPEILYQFDAIKPVSKALEEASKWHRAVQIAIERGGTHMASSNKSILTSSIQGNYNLAIDDHESTYNHVRSDNTMDRAEELLKLHELKEKGILTTDEFEDQKKKILSRAY
ncbi:SHOCT domain-containing protein [Mucilaginibacter sp. Bleaf8]|uniref:SHOCT domain-containing protein n=1 Tax=Mucilaginibacter sp. Bleaf8 TaxID=2834430 RepID=UPI001BCBD4A4|nr:SHOCT domain-containing protein [Mucilaginibacter sp. Bleaf8]MBS7565833.1 SHOCT domain-containing protein [Mucilaginibacter sp. Bleaf8]